MEAENFFEISLGHGEDMRTYMVKDYEKSEDGQCKFEVFLAGKLILSLEPDGDTFRSCENLGGLNDETIHQVIDRIEAYHL
jgi:hypothetical protein